MRLARNMKLDHTIPASEKPTSAKLAAVAPVAASSAAATPVTA